MPRDLPMPGYGYLAEDALPLVRQRVVLEKRRRLFRPNGPRVLRGKELRPLFQALTRVAWRVN